MPPTAAIPVAIYVRISKDETGRALGVERQEAAVRKMLTDTYGPGGYVVVDVYSDNNISAWKQAKRPQYERLLQHARTGRFDVIGVYATDRLYRRMTDLEDIIRAIGEKADEGVDLVAVTGGFVDLTTSDGRLKARIMAATAQHESDRKSDRIREQRVQAAAKGWAASRPTFGYNRVFRGKDEGAYLVVVEAEADTLRFLAAEILAGASQGKAADRANAAERWNRGKVWTGGDVRKVLTRPTVAGLCVHRGEIAGAGDWEEILDRDTWETVKAELTDPTRKHKRKRNESNYWLRGVLVDVHGQEMRGARMASRGDRQGPGTYDRRAYKRATTIDADAIEAMLTEWVRGHLHVLSWDAPEELAVSPERSAIAAIEADMVELAAERGAGTITKAEYTATRKGLQRRLDEAKAALPVRQRKDTPRVSPGDLVKRWETPVDRGGLRPDEKHEIVRWALGRVTIGPAKGGRASGAAVAARVLAVEGPLSGVVG
jgi:site-specific DNA recombinase